MSANDEDEFGVAADLEDLLATPKPAAKKAPAKAAPEQAAAPDPRSPDPKLEAGLTAEQVKIMVAEMKGSLRAEIEADLKNPKPGQPVDNRPIDNRPTAPIEEGTPENGILVHFITDGFTVGARLFYRGEEFIAPVDSDWASLSAAQQTARYGQQYFRPGPWEGQGFDLSDPALTEEDKVKLAEIMRQRAAAEPPIAQTTGV